jgi:hypothetical protein
MILNTIPKKILKKIKRKRVCFVLVLGYVMINRQMRIKGRSLRQKAEASCEEETSD